MLKNGPFALLGYGISKSYCARKILWLDSDLMQNSRRITFSDLNRENFVGLFYSEIKSTVLGCCIGSISTLERSFFLIRIKK